MKIVAQVTFVVKVLILGILVYICRTDPHKMYAKFARRTTETHEIHRTV